MRENLQCLLNDINVILQKEKVKKEESRKRGERFNMFELLGVAHYEVTHFKIIACFLDPKASHGQGDLFLKLFLNTIDNQTDLNTAKAEVFTEYDIKDKGRIDIFIKDNLGNGIIIENKVYASDQDKQLIRYKKFADSTLTNKAIYYLTLYGNNASESSSKGVTYNRISYTEHIVNWLQSCIQHSATMPTIRESLVQYLNHIKQLTNQDMDSLSNEELIKLLGSGKNFETIISLDNFLVKNLVEIKKQSEAQQSIVRSWEEELKKVYPNITILNPEEYDDRAIFVVNIREFYAYLGWSRDNYPKSVLFCQVEYDSEFRCKKLGRQRPIRDEKIDNLKIGEILKDKNEWCRFQQFGKAYGDYARVFECLKQVIERITEAMPK